MKLIRADYHLNILRDKVAGFLQLRPYEVVAQHDISTSTYSACVRYRERPPDVLLMLIGDVLGNLRAALEHMAWSLAGSRADGRTEFPIFLDAIDFRNGRRSGLIKMHDMPACAQGLIEQMQPYHGLNGPPEAEPLWLLHQLHVEDKHHAFNLVAAGVDIALGLRTSSWHPAYGLSGRTGYLPLKDGAEIFRIPIHDPSQVKDYSHTTFDVAFDPEGPGRGISVRQGLSEMREAVAWALRSLEPMLP